MESYPKEREIKHLQTIAELSAQLEIANKEKDCALAILNSEHPTPIDNDDLAVWINEISKDFASAPFSTDIEMSQFLWEWLPHVRATRMLGISVEEGDLDE